MRPSKTTLAPVALVFAAVVLLSCSAHRAEKSAISIAVLGYENFNITVEARLAITNIGYMAIHVGEALLKTESPSGSRTAYNDARFLSVSTNALLKPGSNTLTTVLLPADTLRWQVRFTVRAVDHPEENVWSQVFECPLTGPKRIFGPYYQ